MLGEKSRVEVLLVGERRVGKTLLWRMVAQKYQTRRVVYEQTLRDRRADVTLADGTHLRVRDVPYTDAADPLPFAHATLIVYDVANLSSFAAVRRWNARAGKGVRWLVANTGSVSGERPRLVASEDGEIEARTLLAGYSEINCFNPAHIAQLMGTVATYAREMPDAPPPPPVPCSCAIS